VPNRRGCAIRIELHDAVGDGQRGVPVGDEIDRKGRRDDPERIDLLAALNGGYFQEGRVPA
jgi:hypothetical protein